MSTGAKVKFGFKGVIAANGGTYATPTWSAMNNVAEAKIAMSRAEAEASMRAYPVKLTESIMREIEFEGTIRSDDGDTNGYILMEAAFIANAPLDVLILDGPIGTNGSRGVRCDMKVFKWEEDEGLDKLDYRAFTLKPCIPINGAPADAVAGASSITYTAMSA
ncbi:MAG: hypothetical protein JWO38_4878 [Gemmataceae bacterium]|nr:hypothetical protein [Gemmataceae bacterium]